MTRMPLDRIRATAHRQVRDVSDLVQSIREVGLLQPLVVDAEGNLVAGYHRYLALRELGWEEVPVVAIYVGTQRPESPELEALVRHWQRSWLIPGEVPVKTVQTKGSGDPYVVIPERVLRKLLPWHVVLGDALR